jgi:hypothetical protein
MFSFLPATEKQFALGGAERRWTASTEEFSPFYNRIQNFLSRASATGSDPASGHHRRTRFISLGIFFLLTGEGEVETSLKTGSLKRTFSLT